MPHGFSFDVFITDDGCTDGTAEAVECEFPSGIRRWDFVLEQRYVKGLASGSNFLKVWLNDYTILLPDAIINLIEASKECEDKSLIVGTTCAVGHPEIIT